MKNVITTFNYISLISIFTDVEYSVKVYPRGDRCRVHWSG